MSWKNLAQNSLADSLLVSHDCIKELDAVHDIIEWKHILNKINHLHTSNKGEPAWPPLLMFKILLLQNWYDLSDPKMEVQLARDLMFRRFVNLSLSESVPDHSTICRFRNLLIEEKLIKKLFKEINRQLRKQNLIMGKGSVAIIDASVIEAHQCRSKKNKTGESTQDPDATWNVKTNAEGKKEAVYGFKGHINVDEDAFVRCFEYTTGSSHDSQTFEVLLTGEEAAAYADSAYQSKKTTELLKKRGVRNCVTRRAYRNNPLSDIDKAFNKVQSGTRSIVESVFGVMKLHQGFKKARYFGLAKNEGRFGLQCIAYNLKRALRVYKECGVL